mmetsp:Transcript_6409/g.9436  ORF Transcript_6409/g.9436 Transcript_6409/m.9436 type:complete len:313 (+) Transcript_6409:2524-3462(+)
MGEEYKSLAHGLVLRNNIGVLGGFAHNVAVLVLYNEYLLGLGHVCNHDIAHASEDGAVDVLAGSSGGLRAVVVEVEGLAGSGGVVVVVEVLGEHVPGLEADAEYFRVINLGHAHKVKEAGEEGLLALSGLKDLEVSLDKAGEEEREALDEDAVLLGAVLKGRREVGLGCEYLTKAREEAGKELAEERVVLRLQILQVANLSEALKRVVAEERLREELVQQHLNQRRLEDEAQRDPRQKPLQRLQRHAQQTGSLAVLQDELAQMVYRGELPVQTLLHAPHLLRHHLISREVEHFLGKQLQDLHVVLAQDFRCL